MTIIIDTPEGIAAARLIALRSGLSLEIKTGMKLTRGRSASQIAIETVLVPAGIVAQGKRPNKKTVYGLLDAYMVECGLSPRPLTP